ncbi:LRR receptor serine/threonine-protein [Salix suchowensis]|nr:LRR receptor serine/threonine-protein [Salix suchowensis]
MAARASKGTAFRTKIQDSVLLLFVIVLHQPETIKQEAPSTSPAEDKSKQHQRASKPAWLLALEIVTGTCLVYKGTMKGADLARLNNENTGKLLGYCKESTPFTRMLVIEYASNGTLYEHLHYGDGCNLSWTRRMKIVKGIARGLKYLHTELEPPFTISELNSSSVYLTEEFSPKLVDFESWKSILARSEKNSGAIGSQGAICVLPHSLEGRHLDVQGNIYAFGVLLLEIISGRPPYCKDKGRLVDWAKDFLELPEAMAYVVDPELKHFRFEDLKVICEVVNLCIHPDPTKQPPCMS